MTESEFDKFIKAEPPRDTPWPYLTKHLLIPRDVVPEASGHMKRLEQKYGRDSLRKFMEEHAPKLFDPPVE